MRKARRLPLYDHSKGSMREMANETTRVPEEGRVTLIRGSCRMMNCGGSVL